MKKIALQIPVAECQLTIECIERWIVLNHPDTSVNPYFYRLECYVLYEVRDALFGAISSARRKEKQMATIKLPQVSIDVLHNAVSGVAGIESLFGSLLKFASIKRPVMKDQTSIDTHCSGIPHSFT